MYMLFVWSKLKHIWRMENRKMILITGAGPNGVTGHLIKDKLSTKYDILTPSSKELDLTNDEEVDFFFRGKSINYIIHCATFRSNHNISHFVDEELESNIRMYFNLAKHAHEVEKMIYFGSGAEYDKSKPIIEVSEENVGLHIPYNKYGLGKYVMNTDCRRSQNIYNLRLFGTINKYEHPNKNIISNICLKLANNIDVTLKRDCRFSFVDINDVITIMEYVMANDLNHHDYNIVSDDSYLISEIAEKLIVISGKQSRLLFEQSGCNLEYSASNNRIKAEMQNFKFTDINYSLYDVFNYIDMNKDMYDIKSVDSRWNVHSNGQYPLGGGGGKINLYYIAAA